jgi:Bacterial Ig-like domain
MTFQKGLLFLSFYALLIIGAIGHSGCANIVPPSGGPKDTIPPVLLSATPPNPTLHFGGGKMTGQKIIFKFDEYIDPKDIRTELVVNPLPKVEPITDGHLQLLTVRLKDTLQPNTTYSLNFYKGIKDVNEGNVLKNFTYVFSTGDHIDSGQVAGQVILALTGKADSSMVVVLHRKFDDSAVVKDRPRYLTKVDTLGRFSFNYLEPGRYAIYAMKDEGGSHKYLSKSQLFAFADSPITVNVNYGHFVQLYAYSEIPETKSKSSNSSGNSGGSNGSNKSSTPKPKKEKDKRLQLSVNAANNVFDALDTFRVTFTQGLKLFDSTQIRFTDENFKDVNLKQYRWVRDTLNKNFDLYFFWPWPLDTKFNLILPKTAVMDSAGRKLLKDDTITFRTKKDIDYGEIRIRAFNLDLARKPVLLMFQGDALKHSFAFGNKKEIRKLLFKPGDYELRILFDTNGNGKWDPGEFFKKHRQPEKVITIRKKFTVKANWDNDWDYTF